MLILDFSVPRRLTGAVDFKMEPQSLELVNKHVEQYALHKNEQPDRASEHESISPPLHPGNRFAVVVQDADRVAVQLYDLYARPPDNRDCHFV